MNYAHLDELWEDYPSSGKSVTGSKKKSSKKKKSILDEPLCDLYSQQTLGMEPPYYQQPAKYDKSQGPRPSARDLEFQNVRVGSEDAVYDTYSSYNDDDMYLMSAANEISSPSLPPQYEYAHPSQGAPTINRTEVELDTEAEDEIVSNLFIQQQNQQFQTMNRAVFEYGGQVNTMSNELKAMQNMMIDLSDQLKRSESNKTEYLDFAVFVIGGIMLIFIMEQFLQIGVNINIKKNMLNKVINQPVV